MYEGNMYLILIVWAMCNDDLMIYVVFTTGDFHIFITNYCTCTVAGIYVIFSHMNISVMLYLCFECTYI